MLSSPGSPARACLLQQLTALSVVPLVGWPKRLESLFGDALEKAARLELVLRTGASLAIQSLALQPH